MQKSRVFLIICDDTDRLFLLASVLHRVFPNSVVQTARDADASLEAARSTSLDGIVASRASNLDEVYLVQRIREVSAVPIVSVVNSHDAETVIAAGASRVLEPERWLLVGKVIADVIGASPAVT